MGSMRRIHGVLTRLGAAVALAAHVPACAGASVRDPGDAITFSLSGMLAPGEEAYLCRYVRMPPEGVDGPGATIYVRGGRHALSEGAHHYLLYRTRLTDWTDAMGDVVRCDEHAVVMKSATDYVTGGQTPQENADFPSGAALPFAPGEILLLQGHFLNASAAPREAKVDLTLRTTSVAKVAQAAGVLRFYDPFIVVPPRGRSRATMRCPIPNDIVLLSGAAHMHARGVAYAAFVDPPNGPPSTTPFYTTSDGLRPTFFVGWQKIPAGSFLRFQCDYASDEDRTVVQGLSAASDEMCMFSGFYVAAGAPDGGGAGDAADAAGPGSAAGSAFRPALSPADEACERMDEHGTGALSCAETTSCLEACPVSDAPDFASGDPRVGACWQRCITSSCPNVTGALFPQLTCTKARCAAECAEMGETCRACVAERCAAELSACQGLACGP
jgi:hypothetical protein